MLYIFYMTAKQEKKHVICYSIHYFMYFSRSICVHLFFLFGHYPGGTRVAVPGYPRRLLPCNIKFNLSDV